jgi:hypothetical protein
MSPRPRLIGRWPLDGLERAILSLGEGEAERRVRRQFHQLISALEHDGIFALASEPPLGTGDSATLSADVM